MRRRVLSLTDEQRHELVQLRDHGRRLYLRERAAALFKIADGLSAHAVAQDSLLCRRRPETILDWLRRYQALGLVGLVQHAWGHRAFLPNAAARAGRSSTKRLNASAFPAFAGAWWTCSRCRCPPYLG